MSEPANPMSMVIKLVGALVTILVLYLLFAGSFTLVFRTRIGAGSKDGFWYTDRKKYTWVPKKWIEWAGEPAKFSNISGVYPGSYSSLKTMKSTKVDQRDCMLACDGENSASEIKCEGFTYDPTSNICNLVYGMDALLPAASSNVIFFVEGYDTARQYALNAGKIPTTPVYIGAEYRAADVKSCAANCFSNTMCTGFTFIPAATATNCRLVQTMDSTTMTSTSGTDTYVFQAHGATTPSSITYWK